MIYNRLIISSLILVLLINQMVKSSFIPIKHRFSSKSMPVEKPIKGSSTSFCDGEVVANQICIYKCKVVSDFVS